MKFLIKKFPMMFFEFFVAHVHFKEMYSILRTY